MKIKIPWWVARMQSRQPSLARKCMPPLRRLVKESRQMRPSRNMGLVIGVVGTSVVAWPWSWHMRGRRLGFCRPQSWRG